MNFERSSTAGLTSTPNTSSDRISHPLLDLPAIPKSAASGATSLLFIDTSVNDYQSLLAGVQPDTEVHVLDSSQDAISGKAGGAIAQITQTLMGRSNISSLHLLSHGSAGGVQLGASWVDIGSLDQHANQLQSWARALTDDADILLYGCDVAEGEIGQTFVQQLARLTSADVAASNDLTGNSTLSGDWVLEYEIGKIESPLAIATGQLAAYQAILANAGDVIINEFSQGNGSAKEWVELLVVTDNLNLQDHRLIDSNGTLDIKLSGVGFVSLKAGTLLVLYNGGDVDGVITPDLTYDPSAEDYSLQISSLNSTENFAITRTTGWGNTTGAFTNSSATDLPQLLNASGTQIHVLPRPAIAASRFTAYQSNSASGANSAAIWSPDGLSTLATPGLGNGGSNTVWVDNLRGNVAPVLDTSGNPTLPSINQGVTNPNGVRVTDLISSLGGAGITDVDRGLLNGIAVTGVNNTNGSWEYSTNGGSTWTAFGNSVADTSATVLLGSASLYNSALGSVPDQQGWLSYTNLKIESGVPTPGTSTQSANTSGTILNTTADSKNYAGYSNYDVAQQQVNPTFPALDRASGYGLSFNLQLLSESRTNQNRAGFSVIAISSDKRGIELGFQQITSTTGRIFAQSDDITPNPGGEPNGLFLAAESVSFDTNQAVNYSVNIKGDTYQLLANGVQILTGVLRNYTNWNSAPDPYETPNFIFLGDDTTSAQASFNLSQVVLRQETRVRFVPNGSYTGSSEISFRAWDGTNGVTSGASGVNASLNGGTTAFSMATETAAITVNSLPTLSINNVTQTEGNSGTKTYTFTVNLSQASQETVTVNYGTIDGSATISNNDYLGASGTLTFNAGEVSKTIAIQVNGDTNFELDETFLVKLSNASNAKIIAGADTGVGTVVDDDKSGWTIAKTADFDKDGKVDILWRNSSTGGTAIWKMNGTTFETSIPLAVADTNWRIESVADFDKNGYLDLLWRNTNTGTTAIWMMNGFTVTGSVALPAAPIDWSIEGVADFDRDGFVDILWRNTNTGGNAIWKMNGTSVATSIALSATDLSWQIKGIADFDNDGFVDILWHNNATGGNAFWKMNGMSVNTSVALSVTPSEWQIAGIADFDQDGVADILWRNTSTGGMAIWKMNGTGAPTSTALSFADLDWQVEDLSDLDGDGFVDIVWRNYSTGGNALWKMNGTMVTTSIALRPA